MLNIFFTLLFLCWARGEGRLTHIYSKWKVNRI